MDNIVSALKESFLDFLPNYYNQIDFGLNVISIFFVWLGIIPNLAFLNLIGLGLLALSLFISSFKGGIKVDVVITELLLMMVGGYMLFKFENMLIRLVVAVMTTYICLGRMGLI
jgi:hypothetical protein